MSHSGPPGPGTTLHSKHCLDDQEPLLPPGLQHHHQCNRLCLSLSDASTRCPWPSAPLGANVSSIEGDTPPSKDLDLATACPSIAADNIAARKRGPPEGGLPPGHASGRPIPGRPNDGRHTAPRPSGTLGGFIIKQPAPCAFAPCAGSRTLLMSVLPACDPPLIV